VCCVENPLKLQEETEYQWNATGKARVFGVPELIQLAGHLKE
jgi:hypothetical protein